MADGGGGTRKGVSLAKGPVGVLGLIGIVYGVSALLFASHGFALHIPHGAVSGKRWIGLRVNGWSELLFIAAGLALVLAAPLHWGAKSMSLLVGLVLLAAAVIAVIRKDGVFGIFAANHLTELVWAAAGVLLLLLALLPRVGGRDGQDGRRRDRQDASPPAAPRPQGRPTRAERRASADEPLTEPRSAPVDSGPSRHERWIDGADEQDRPPDAGARKRDNPSR